MNAYDKETINKEIYEKIKYLYENECRTIKASCEKINIKIRRFYNICYKYQLPLISERNKAQKGGYNKINKLNNFKNIKLKLISKDENNTKNNNINANIGNNMSINVNNEKNNINTNKNNDKNNSMSTNVSNEKNNISIKTNMNNMSIEQIKKIYNMQQYLNDLYEKKVKK